MQDFRCIVYKGNGKQLKRHKVHTKRSCENIDSFFRLSTCQRIEIYGDGRLPSNSMRVLQYPDSLQHLVEVLSGIDSGLFGEIEVYMQARNAFETAKEENHISEGLEKNLIKAFNIADDIRKQFGLNNSWISSIIRKIGNIKNVMIYGDGNLAKALEESFVENGLHIKEDKEKAEAIIILKRGLEKPEFNSPLIINLTDDKFKKDEIEMKEFFIRPKEDIVNKIKEEIKKKII